MNRRMKILVLVLLAAVLCLSAAVAHRALGDAGSGGTAETSGTDNTAQSEAVTLFVENGLWGARSPGGRVLLEPRWYYLRIMNDDLLVARKQIDGSVRSGLIRTDGSVIVPFLYSSFEEKSDTLWIASIEEQSGIRYHIYRSDGTRWSDMEWERCDFADDLLTLGAGTDTVTYRFRDGAPVRESWESIHEVGLHSLLMRFDANALSSLPETVTLRALGNAAADFLTYLFVDESYIDSALFSGDPESVAVSGRYRDCTLMNAEVSGVTVRETQGFPAYLVQISVKYRRSETGGGSSVIDTALSLTVSRNAAGAFTFSGFRDARPDLAGLNR
jgi:hypothetical protein